MSTFQRTICICAAQIVHRTPSVTSVLCVSLVVACASLPPGAHASKTPARSLAHPETTRLGSTFARAAHAHGDTSGFRIINAGRDAFLLRLEAINAAEQTIDAQYYIFRGDTTGGLMADALQRAADRGVRIRILVDDGDTTKGDEQLFALNHHRETNIRVFNPFSYGGHNHFLRGLEFVFNAHRLDHRMHNKLLIIDGSLAISGGRNIGDQYFQIDPQSQFGDDDVVAVGPICSDLSAAFDEYWNSALSIPAEALNRGNLIASLPHRVATPEAAEYKSAIESGQPYAGIISDQSTLVWANAQLVHDSPDKADKPSEDLTGQETMLAVGNAIEKADTELLMVTPYLVPSAEELARLKSLRQHHVRIRILTNSLEASRDPLAHAGYTHYRASLLQEGVELYEIRARPEKVSGVDQPVALSQFGNFALHAKLFVFDRKALFIGSLNFDQRSKRLNTEAGLLIKSPELANQTAKRFDALTVPENSYSVTLQPGANGTAGRLLWSTRKDGRTMEYTREPAQSAWRRFKARLLAVLPLDQEL